MAAPLEQSENKAETQAEDITIQQGEMFDPASDFKGITVKDGEKISFVLSADKEGKLFDADRPEPMTVFTRSKNLPVKIMRLQGKSL